MHTHKHKHTHAHTNTVMNPPEPAVATYAIQYISVRAWGIPAVLAGFVSIGTYRGFKV